MSKYLDPTKHTAEEWRAMGHQSYAHADESFDRCDTDGFMTQWADGIMAQQYELCAKVVENGGKWAFRKLFTLDGQPVKARLVDGKYGTCWMILNEAGRGVGFAPYAPARPSTLAKRGYKEEFVDCPALVTCEGTSITSVSATVVEKWY